MPSMKDLSGCRFGRLLVINFDRRELRKNGGPLLFWICKCDCGNKISCRAANLLSGRSTSCGCGRIEAAIAANTTHALSKSPEYLAFYEAKRRCTDRKDKRWKYYGGRGIKFLFTSVEQWVPALGKRPTPQHTVDRRNNDGHYEPGNVRWATRKEQALNRRAASR